MSNNALEVFPSFAHYPSLVGCQWFMLDEMLYTL